jgi:hypothetical protein
LMAAAIVSVTFIIGVSNHLSLDLLSLQSSHVLPNLKTLIVGNFAKCGASSECHADSD